MVFPILAAALALWVIWRRWGRGGAPSVKPAPGSRAEAERDYVIYRRANLVWLVSVSIAGLLFIFWGPHPYWIAPGIVAAAALLLRIAKGVRLHLSK